MTGDSVIVIGGGLAGLSTAVELVDAGLKPVVLEKRPVIGGKVSSWQDADGDWVESGLHIFFGSYKELLAMMRRVDAYKNVHWKQHRLFVAQPGGKNSTFFFPSWPAPFNGMVAFTATNLFTPREKLSNIFALIRPWLMSLKAIEKWDALSYADWHRKNRIAEGVMTKWWNPISLSMGFLPAEEMSARPMTTVFHHFSRSGIASRIGFLNGAPGERLHKPFADYISAHGGSVETNARAESLELAPDGSISGVRMQDGSLRTADAYVLAAPLHSTRQLLPAELRRQPYFDNLWKLKSVPVMNVQIWFDRYISSIDNLFFTKDAPFSVFADLAITAPQDYDKHNGSLVSMAVAPAAPLWQLSDDEIAARCLDALKNLWPRVRSAKVLKQVVVRIPNSIYRESPGSDRYRPEQKTPIANLFIAGDFTRQDYMASMEGAVRSGRRAAAEVIASANRSEITHEVVGVGSRQ